MVRTIDMKIEKGEMNLGFISQDEPNFESEENDKFEDKLENNNPTRIKKTSATSVTSTSSAESVTGSKSDTNTVDYPVGKLKKVNRGGSTASANENVVGINGRRRSSAEIIRQSRAYKRLSKAFSSIGQLPEITEYQLVGISEEVSKF